MRPLRDASFNVVFISTTQIRNESKKRNKIVFFFFVHSFVDVRAQSICRGKATRKYLFFFPIIDIKIDYYFHTTFYIHLHSRTHSAYTDWRLHNNISRISYKSRAALNLTHCDYVEADKRAESIFCPHKEGRRTNKYLFTGTAQHPVHTL